MAHHSTIYGFNNMYDYLILTIQGDHLRVFNLLYFSGEEASFELIFVEKCHSIWDIFKKNCLTQKSWIFIFG
jgi:hypothetical protein